MEWWLEFDSNVLSNNQLGTDFESDFSNRLAFTLGKDFHLESGSRIQGQYQYTQTRWLDATQYDTDIHTGFLRYSQRQGAWIKDGVYLHAQANIAGDEFLTLNRLSPALSYFASKSWFFRTQVDLSHKAFPIYQDRDAFVLGIKPSGYWLIDKMQHYVRLQLHANQEWVTNDPFDRSSVSGSLSWNYRTGDTRWTLEGEMEDTQYDRAASANTDARHDQTTKATIKWQRHITDSIQLRTQITYDQNTSSLAEYDYEQVRGLIKLRYEW